MSDQPQPGGLWLRLPEGVRKEIREWVVTLLYAAVIYFVLRTFIIEARRIPTPSMIPTIQLQDRVLEEKIVWRFTGLKRGDIVVFKPPFDSQFPYIKRVVALPGEKVEVRDGKVYINDAVLEETYTSEPAAQPFGPLIVPEGKVIVMGDNRNKSYDSRSWGPLDLKSVSGRAVWRYWPPTRFGPVD